MTDRPTVILLHGAALNGGMWQPVQRALESRFQVLAPDLPGHGARDAERFTLGGAVSTTLDALRQAGPGPVVVMGDSLGGYSAMAAAAHLPRERLKGLLLAGCSSNIMGLRRLPFFLQRAVFGSLTRLLGADAVQRQVEEKLRQRLAPEHAAALIERGVHLAAFGVAIDAITGVDFRARIANVDVPMLFVNGNRDYWHRAYERRFVAGLARARIVRYPGAEHGVTLWHSATFTPTALQFAQDMLMPGADSGGR